MRPLLVSLIIVALINLMSWFFGRISGLGGSLFSLWWLYQSIIILGPDEMGIEILFGKMQRFRDSGIHFIPYLVDLWYMKRSPKKLYQVNLNKIRVVSKAGKYPNTPY